ncbi:methyltransferase domain-containing protein [Corallincola holothuriorum]|uniref:Methyltransferase domain-containing protein n=3 Tax=Psychromonadaceae TaxID=267894 RepID=A0A368NLW8_9GAMM|nr:methyltransferase domain-containing protein [Corallincola holothuriorum]
MRPCNSGNHLTIDYALRLIELQRMFKTHRGNIVRMQPDTWQQLPHGLWLRGLAEERLRQWWPRMFGYHLLKLGGLSAQLSHDGCPIKHAVSLGRNHGDYGITSALEALPVSEYSVDACLMAFTLNFSSDPHQLMREAHRVLIANGHLITLTFNPYSLLGAAKYCPGNKSKLPWTGQMLSPHRLKDWMRLLGHEVIWQEPLFHGSLCGQTPAWPWWERSAAKVVAPMAGASLLISRKRELPLTPIRPLRAYSKRMKAPALAGQVRSNTLK